MSTYDPIGLLFGGMEKLSPGSNADTLHVLRLLPKRQLSLVVDAGCGTGRQTLALAKELGVLVHAIDSYQPFLNELVQRAGAAQVEHLVEAHCMDMQAIPQTFRDIDLLWSEGAAYSIGFPNALTTWAPALAPGGLVVVSELSWLKEQAPEEVKEFFRSGYPDMRSVQDNIEVARNAGYKVITTHVLPKQAWVDGYYDTLGPRAKALLDHQDAAVRDFAAETVTEINVFDRSEDSYGYVFYALQCS
jgi:cyclopropane fatty-acyl-phospholipid synthase-like methyltransferase